MDAPRQSSIEEWRKLAADSPEFVVDRFLSEAELLSPLTSGAVIASHHPKEKMVEHLKAGCALNDGPLSAVPYILQDLFDVAGLPTLCGAPFKEMLDAALEDSSLLHQKLGTLGAAFFAKTVPAEFGVDLQGRNKTHGACPHPSGQKFAGGGGAGTAARTVYEGLVPLAFGLDTCGGVRTPAAFQGLFGFRMGTNSYAREGVFPIAPSIESIGAMTTSLSDMLTVFAALHRLKTETSQMTPRGVLLTELSGSTALPIKKGLFEIARELNAEDDPSLIATLRESLGHCGEALMTIRSRELYSIHQYWLEEYRDKYDPALLEAIEHGKHCSAFEIESAASNQEKVRSAFTRFFDEYDYLLMPICHETNPERRQWTIEFESHLQNLLAPASLAFLPALILPLRCGPDRFGAAQLIVNPHKLNVVPEIVAQIKNYYEAESGSE